jgi:hypothetical protein
LAEQLKVSRTSVREAIIALDLPADRAFHLYIGEPTRRAAFSVELAIWKTF